jgi:hypothetical protein
VRSAVMAVLVASLSGHDLTLAALRMAICPGWRGGACPST